MSVATAPRTHRPLNLASRDFTENKFRYYAWMRREAPVYRAKLTVLTFYCLPLYDDCLALLKDPRFVRNRSTATGGGRMPFPIPRSLAFLVKSMITEDEPAHTRLRKLVNKAFTPRSVARLEPRIQHIAHELIDRAEKQGTVDLLQAYSLPIPTTVIGEMMGVSREDEEQLRTGLRVMSTGLTGWAFARTLAWDMPRVVKFIRGLIARKRSEPGDDILTGLIEVEEDGDRLTEDEIVSMVFLLMIAGYETTGHLITNGVAALLEHPDQLARLRAEPDLIDSAVEEMLRFCGPVHGTKPNYATEDVTLHGVTIPKGSGVEPLLASANRDPAVFDDPDVFDIARTNNRHLAFSHGIHFCLGAHLARMETRIAIATLVERSPDLRLAVAPETLRLQNLPMWQRYQELPVALR
jgi:cytochrome P450